MINNFEKQINIHIELSDYCNSRCALCSRERLTDKAFNKNKITLENFKDWIPPEVIKNVYNFTFTGTYGDFITNNDVPDIVEYIKQNNLNCSIMGSSNGGIKNDSFYENLALSLDPKDEFSFHLDGVEEDHTRYRENVSYQQVLKNAKIMSENGHKVNWGMSPFEHSEHSIPWIKENHKKLGFKSLMIKPNWIGRTDLYGTDARNSKGETLKEASNKRWSAKYSQVEYPYKVECRSKQKNEIYIDSSGVVVPCCYMGTFIRETFTQYFEDGTISDEGQHNKYPWLKQWVLDNGHISDYDLHNDSLYNILQKPLFSKLDNEFENKENTFCSKRCGTNRPDNGYTFSKICKVSQQP